MHLSSASNADVDDCGDLYIQIKKVEVITINTAKIM
jgi:hypothetical protein